MTILNYKLTPTNELLTARTGLLTLAHLMQSLDLGKAINRHFPASNSNSAFKASTFINTLVLSQHEGGKCLDDTLHIAKDKALSLLLQQKIPTPQVIGTWLRRLGKDNQGITALSEVNKILLSAALHNRKNITLDIDATEVIANKANAQWTYTIYKKHKGYMPMVGHIAQTGQIVATDFRQDCVQNHRTLDITWKQ
ncbi:MAG: hypothetical protein FE834_00020 [Gammaproteobacteria bacterium]|nr:hypothetical protein [Gammaproteobacteria bacterium]